MSADVPAALRPRMLRDSVTLLDRQLRHVWRYPDLTVGVLAVPVIILLLFVYVLGDTLGAGLPGVAAGDRGDYADYVVPGVLVLTITTIAAGTATTMAMDTTQGIVARFRTLPIAPGAVLVGHVLGAVLQTLGALAVVLGVALLVGFRPQAGVAGWLAVAALLAGLSLAVSWLSVALGLLARTVESASNYPMPLLLLPILGSGFVPADSMPPGLSWFAEYQPFTPIMDTLRGLLLGTPVEAGAAWASGLWCAALALVGYAWARALFGRPRRA